MFGETIVTIRNNGLNPKQGQWFFKHISKTDASFAWVLI